MMLISQHSLNFEKLLLSIHHMCYIKPIHYIGHIGITYKGLYYSFEPPNNSERYKEQIFFSLSLSLPSDEETEQQSQLPCWKYVGHVSNSGHKELSISGLSITSRSLRASSGPLSSTPPHPQPPTAYTIECILSWAPQPHFSLSSAVSSHAIFTEELSVYTGSALIFPVLPPHLCPGCSFCGACHCFKVHLKWHISGCEVFSTPLIRRQALPVIPRSTLSVVLWR